MNDDMGEPYANYHIALASADTGIRGSAFYIWASGPDDGIDGSPVACIPFSTKEPEYHSRARARAEELIRRGNAYDDLVYRLTRLVHSPWNDTFFRRKAALELLSDLNETPEHFDRDGNLADTKNE